MIHSLKKLKIKKFYAILVHNCAKIKNKKTILKTQILLEKLKAKGFCNYYGLSVYNLKDYNRLKNMINPKIIQANLNYFDREFLYDRNFSKSIKKNKILFFTRSIFLQGVLLIDKKELPQRLRKLNRLLVFWEKICHLNELKKIEMAKNFIFNQKNIFRTIVGFQSYNEFKEFVAIRNKKKIIDLYSKKHFKFFYNILKPYKW